MKQSGELRAVEDVGDCRPSERPLEWNVQGPPGPEGEPGPQGERSPSSGTWACPEGYRSAAVHSPMDRNFYAPFN